MHRHTRWFPWVKRVVKKIKEGRRKKCDLGGVAEARFRKGGHGWPCELRVRRSWPCDELGKIIWGTVSGDSTTPGEGPGWSVREWRAGGWSAVRERELQEVRSDYHRTMGATEDSSFPSALFPLTHVGQPPRLQVALITTPSHVCRPTEQWPFILSQVIKM